MDFFISQKRNCYLLTYLLSIGIKYVNRFLQIIFIITALIAQNTILKGQTTEKAIFGIVINQIGEALPGATVKLGNNLVTKSNDHGEFIFRSKDGFHLPIELTVSYVGYEAKKITIKTKGDHIRVQLHADRKQIEESVIIGYGKSSREKLTSSVAKISGQTLVQQPIQNPVLGLQGRVAGLYITAPSGNLGANPTIILRGDNTILSSPNPLYIIDGVPMPSSGINSSYIGGASSVQSPFINLNSADIASVEVLKDAAATAIYGARGANGVILITTKKGSPGKTRINLDLYKGYQQAVNKLDLLSTSEYLKMRRDAFVADGIEPTASNAPDLITWDSTSYTDFQDLLFGEVVPLTDLQTSIQGGNDKTNFILAMGFRDENSVIMNANNQKKGTVRLNVNHRGFDDKLSVDGSVNYTVLSTKSIGVSGISAFNNSLAPNLPLVDEETGLPYFFSTESWGASPLRYQYSGTNLKNYQLVASGTVGYNILDNLNFKVDGSYTRLDYNGIEQYKKGYYNPYANNDYDNSAYFGTNYQYTYNIEPQLNYNTQLGLGKLSGLVGFTLQETINGGQLVEGRNFANEQLMSNLGSASRINSYSSTYNQYKFNSIFGRLTYDHTNKYIVNATFRRDGSSRFAPENRFGNFWALGTAWILSNEDFFKDNSGVISFAKIRTSYGLTGNDAISNYQYMETFQSTSYPYNNTAGMYANRLGNPEFKWESNHQFEAALELNLFNNRIATTTAFFNKQGSNQLVNYPIATQTGWTSYVANLDGALIRNRGLEFEFISHNMRSDDFNWRTNFNFTTYKNTLVSFPGLSASTYSDTYEVGKSINVYRRYEFDYVDPTTGIPYVVDQNDDGVINTIEDYISYGTSDPSFYGGLGNTFSYKGLDMDVFFQFTKQPYANGLLWKFNMPIGNIYNVPRFLMEEVWRSEEDPGTLPRLSTTTSGTFYNAYVNRYGYSTAIMEDASFIRLKNLSLSYTIPVRYAQKLKLQHLKVYVLGQNLFTWTKYKGLDPETGNTSTPLLKVYTLGINLSL